MNVLDTSKRAKRGKRNKDKIWYEIYFIGMIAANRFSH
jgi:hypothetical protein